MLKLCVFVPESHLELVKSALFGAGAGRIGNYDSCSWQVKGEGQFRPLSGSKPWLGDQGKLESASEYKLELVLEEALLAQVINALRESHPYEEPAFDVIQLVSV